MKKALIVYHSKTGVTRALGKEISEFISSLGVGTTFYSINDFRAEDAAGADFVLLGCWTHGLFIVLQHPDANWTGFSRKLPDLSGKKIALFTTYTIATGSMFSRMAKRIPAKQGDITLRLKSRDGRLSETMKSRLRQFIGTDL